jgi:hypothetical protein
MIRNIYYEDSELQISMASHLIWMWTSRTCYPWEMAIGAVQLQKYITFYILLPESMDGQRATFQNIKKTT